MVSDDSEANRMDESSHFVRVNVEPPTVPPFSKYKIDNIKKP